LAANAEWAGVTPGVRTRFTLRFKESGLPEAQILADAIENDIRFDITAVALEEIDEIGQSWQVIAYFDNLDAARTARTLFGLNPEALQELPDADWVAQSLRGLRPVRAGRFFLHGSHDRHLRKAGFVNIELDAQTAFGTGHHGTTRGCLEAFDGLVKLRRPENILDLGSGTGVLAIAAAKLHCRYVLATDIDALAVTVTRANARLNYVSGRFDTAVAPGVGHLLIAKAAPYDVIFANILARPLASLATSLRKITKLGGYIILSGITLDQIPWIKACYVNSGLSFVRLIAHENWATLVLRA
jgi:ribosomal protein L11 methyltransferase